MSYQEYKHQHKNELTPSQKNAHFLKVYYYISKLLNKCSWSQNNVINFTITFFFIQKIILILSKAITYGSISHEKLYFWIIRQHEISLRTISYNLAYKVHTIHSYYLIHMVKWRVGLTNVFPFPIKPYQHLHLLLQEHVQ